MPDAGKRPFLTPMQWRVFALACGTSFLLYLHRYSWNIVGPMLQADFGLSNKQAGFLFSLFYYTYAGVQIPLGVIIDRFGAHRFLSLAIIAWSAVLVAIGQSASATLIGVSRLLFGAAQAGCYPALTKVSAGWFEPARRTVLQGWIATTAGRGGGALAPIVLGTLLMGRCGLSWEQALGVLGTIGALYGLLFWVAYRDPSSPSTGWDSARDLALLTAAVPPATLPWRQAWRNISLRFFTLQLFVDAGSDVAYVFLIGTYFKYRGFDIARTGVLASLPLWGGAIGGIVGGWLNDRAIDLSGNRRWSRSGVGCIGKLVGCFFLATAVGQPSGVAAAWFLCTAKFFSDWSQPTVWGACADMGGRYSATVFSIINTAGTLGGIVMPLVYGEVLDRCTSRTLVAGRETVATDWAPLFFLLAAMYLASGILWLLVDCTSRIEPGDDDASTTP